MAFDMNELLLYFLTVALKALKLSQILKKMFEFYFNL